MGITVGKVASKLALSKRGRKVLLTCLVLLLTLPGLIVAIPSAALFVMVAVFGTADAAEAAEGPQVLSCARVYGKHDLEGKSVGNYSGDQIVNAGAIVKAGIKKEVPTYGIKIAVMTAMGESSLKNIEHGDKAGPDSRGLFQQRDNWGSEKDRLDPAKAAGFFYDALLDVDGWQSMEPTEAAHEVQKNADPNHYQKYWDGALDIVAEVVDKTLCPTTIRPLKKPYSVSSTYGPRDSPAPGASSWHPALDLAKECGAPVMAVTEGEVTQSSEFWLSVKSPDGYVVSYLHTYPDDRLVDVGDKVSAGEKISKVGNAGPSTGCHLDLRINVTDNKNPDVDGLQRSEELGGPSGWVNPQEFMELLGTDICPKEWCDYPPGT